MNGTCEHCGRTITARTLSGQLVWFDVDNDSRCDDYEPHMPARQS